MLHGQRGPKKEDGAHFAQGRPSVGRMHLPRALFCISSSPSSSPQLPPPPTLKGHSVLEVGVTPRFAKDTKNNSNALQPDFCPHFCPSLCKVQSLWGHANCERVRRRRKVICGRDRAHRVLARLRQPTLSSLAMAIAEGSPKGTAGPDGRAYLKYRPCCASK